MESDQQAVVVICNDKQAMVESNEQEEEEEICICKSVLVERNKLEVVEICNDK